MRVRSGALFGFALLSCVLIVVQPARARRADQQPAPRILLAASEPVILTKLGALLATPDTVLVTDYYRIDMRFGPNVALDAVVVTAADVPTRVKGLRIGLHEDANPEARSSASFLDMEEAVSLSRALASMAEQASRWAGQEGQRSTDISFASVGGFAINVHESGRVQRGVLSSGFRDPVHTVIEIADFASLKQGVDQALATLAGK